MATVSRSAASRQRIVLDAGGVLFAEGFRPFLADLDVDAGGDGSRLVDYYNSDLRVPLWTGAIAIDEFWDAIAAFLAVPRDAVWNARMVQKIDLPVLELLEHLETWHRTADLWILSNHRHEWLQPLLDAAGFTPFFDRVLISSELGRLKPDREIFAPLLEGKPARVLFVDDKAENLEAAASLGIDVALAGETLVWTTSVSDWLDRGHVRAELAA